MWTGIIVVALDLATYAEVPFSTIMGGAYLLLTGPAALIYLMSLAAPSLPTMLSSSLADAAIICLLVFCGLYPVSYTHLFTALARFWPLPVAMTSRSSSEVASRSMASRRSRTDSAPMPPVK